MAASLVTGTATNEGVTVLLQGGSLNNQVRIFSLKSCTWLLSAPGLRIQAKPCNRVHLRL